MMGLYFIRAIAVSPSPLPFFLLPFFRVLCVVFSYFSCGVGQDGRISGEKRILLPSKGGRLILGVGGADSYTLHPPAADFRRSSER